MKAAWFRPGIIATGLAVLVVLAAGYLADRQNSALYREQARAEVAESLSQLRTDMETRLYGSVQLIRGLVGVIASEPDIDQAKFSRIASRLLDGQSQIRNIAGAPNLVVELMHPLAGNEAVIGLDYMQNPDQRDAVVAAMELGTVVLAGPVDLVQGGSGFIVRYPVFVDRPDNAGTKPWGLIAAVIDVDQFFAQSGLLSEALPVQVALSGRDGVLSHNGVFFGEPDILNRDPVTAQVSLPAGGWQIAAIPQGGWQELPRDVWYFRAMLCAAGLLVVLPVGFAGYLHDQLRARSGKLSHRESEMRKLSQRLNLALETSKIGIWELDLDSGELRWDRRMKELYGVRQGESPDAVEHWINKLHPDDRPKAVAEFEEALESRDTYRSVFRIVPKAGTVRWIRTIGASHQDSDGRKIIIGVNWDVSEELQLKTELIEANQSTELRNLELEEARKQMEHNSLHDVLTGLPNRRFLDERVFGPDADVSPTALVHIDLDRFKQINDTLGHAAGDAMLVHAAQVLRQNTRGTDLVARVGGDEFVVVITNRVDEAWLERFAHRIITQMQKPVRYKDQTCRFGASIGITLADNDGAASNSQMLIDADLALYRAKRSGRNRYEFFDASLKAEIVSQKQLADEILTGLERQEFAPHFQPQFDANTLDITGVEAVARWNHPTRGTLAPSAFLEMAEELSVVHHIDRMILLKTLFQSKRWEAAGLAIPRKSVNVSAGHLNDPELMKLLHGLPIVPGELSFELLESIFLDDENETVSQNINSLSDLGIDIELDDFGTGHASIIGLLHLNPARLKIERRLVKPIVDCARQRKIVSSIIEIGKSLGIEVVAEGVETLEHVAVLRDLGCETLQGFALAKPMTTSELIEFANSEVWRQRAA
ncbi:MAG: EAL domain-containing protein [Pseudomonadota bacterium]